MGKELGKVTHWYDKLSVAVVKLGGALKKGDKVVVKRGDNEFEDTVSSIQVDYKDVDSAKARDDVAIKLSQKAKEGSVIYTAE